MAHELTATIFDSLQEIQQELFDLGGELYFPEKSVIKSDMIKRLEQSIDEWNKTLPPLKEFVLPQGNMASVLCHQARAICRRAERELVALHLMHPITNSSILSYVNRLSDYLFVLARILALKTTSNELIWRNVSHR